MGFLLSQRGQLGAIPPPPFLSVYPLESMRSGGVIPPPPPQKGYLSDTCAISHENKAKRVRYPPLRYYLEKVLRDMWVVSRTGPLSSKTLFARDFWCCILRSFLGFQRLQGAQIARLLGFLVISGVQAAKKSCLQARRRQEIPSFSCDSIAQTTTGDRFSSDV